MAEQGTSTALVPTVAAEYMLDVRDFTPAGTIKTFSLPIPNDVTSEGASVMLRASVLKATTWKDKAFPMVLLAVMYADRMGLDIMAGDVYMAEEGRLSTTADAKIRHAMSTGKIEGYEVTFSEGAALSIPYTVKNQEKVYTGKELLCKVTVHVHGFKAPVVYETKLSEWFTGRNPNWRDRPAYMLRKNALSKALGEVAPMGVDADEAPPAPVLDTIAAPVLALNQAKEAITTNSQTKTEEK